MDFEVKDLQKTIKHKNILGGLSLGLRRGEIVGLLGPNGSGKSTAFHLMMGLTRVDHGQILLNSENITSLPAHQRCQKGLGYLPQGSSIFQKMTVQDNLLAIMELRGFNQALKRKTLDQLIERFSLQDLRLRRCALLSGGERRRVEVARVLINNPQFLLLDEPFAGVDPVTIEQMRQIITELSTEGLGILITDHNAREILRCCERIYVLSGGRVMASGNSEDIIENPGVRADYLGEDFTL